ncbi:hypothetical protein AAFF_G00291140 [Aldrovandia affinis]|uniref:GYF domain-containing protein n=1 Tax=Aldrovandia affinis TaxID=143900 RepID=A0AAD7W1Y5_9TELE|nr:hypothetical protein AAFF_G00291140 [Aldrovandia affinis]
MKLEDLRHRQLFSHCWGLPPQKTTAPLSLHTHAETSPSPVQRGPLLWTGNSALIGQGNMTAETLNFGPEWLRALSSGGSVTSPPPSPAMPKYKLAEYRYGREEMLALYIKDNKVPDEMQEFAAILQDEPLQPLALVPLTEEEQRNFSMSVNSVAVLRLMGKGGGALPTGVARGRGSTRGGRGRGRGDSGFYQRSEEADGGFGRSGREIHRSQSWDDRGERRFDKPGRREGVRVGFEEAGPVVRKDCTRSDSDNWRTLREEQEEEEGAEPGGSWRLAGGRREDGGPRSAGWREHGALGEARRRKFEFDFRDHPEGGRRRAGSEGLEDERDGLPEWCTDEEDGEMGTFDSSGAFLPIRKGCKDSVLEELEFQGLEDEDEEQESERKEERADVLEGTVPPPTDPETPPAPAPHPAKVNKLPSEESAAVGVAQLSPATPPTLPPSSSAATQLPPPGGDTEDDEGMKHLQQEAERMVASLQDSSLEEECFTQTLQESRNTAAALPLSHEAAMKWFYKDPQGEIQGPFTTMEMSEWFQAGYFTMTLLVKRGCDEGFQPLGDVIKMWGRVPFAPGPSQPPLLVSQPQPPLLSRGSTGSNEQERLKKQQELAALYQQLQQQQLFQLINRCGEQSMMPSMNRSMSVPDSGSLWDMHTSASQQAGGEASLWDLTMNSSTQGPTLEQLQKLQERRDAELRAKREEEERKRREEKRRQQEEQKDQCRQQQELIMKLLQQSQQQAPPTSGWSSAQLPKPNKSLNLLELQQQEAERHKQQHHRDRHGSLSVGGQWGEACVPGGETQNSGRELREEEERERREEKRRQQEEQKRREEEELFRRKQQCRQQQELIMKLLQQSQQQAPPTSGWSSAQLPKPNKSLNLLELQQQEAERHKQQHHRDRALKNQSSLRSIGLKNSRSSPSLSEQYMLRRKRTEDEEKLLKLLQGLKPPQDGFTTWCEQMLHALNSSTNNSSCSSDVATIVAYLKEVESPYEVHDFIRSYLGDTVEAKEFAKQFLDRRAKQKANHQRQQQQQQLSKEVAGLTMNFPLQDSMRGLSPSALQSMFQSAHLGKGGAYDGQGGKMKKKQPMMLHSDPSILGYSFHGAGDRLSEMETVEDY